MKKNKIIALVLASLTTLSMLVGCGTNVETVTPSNGDTIENKTDIEANDTTTGTTVYEDLLYVPASSETKVFSSTIEGSKTDQIAFTYDGGEIGIDMYAYGLSQGFFEVENAYIYAGESLEDIVYADYFEEAKSFAQDYLSQALAIDQILVENAFVVPKDLLEYVDYEIDYAEEQMGTEAFEATLLQMGISREGFRNEQIRVYSFETALNEIYGKNEEDLYADYEENYIKAQHILIAFPLDETGNVIEDQREETIKRAEEVLALVNAGDQTFQELMAEYNEDPGQPLAGYAFKEGYMVEEFENSAKSLKEDEVSGLVETIYGVHIVKNIPSSQENYDQNLESINTIEYYVNSEIASQDLYARMLEIKETFKETDLVSTVTADNYKTFFIVD